MLGPSLTYSRSKLTWLTGSIVFATTSSYSVVVVLYLIFRTSNVRRRETKGNESILREPCQIRTCPPSLPRLKSARLRPRGWLIQSSASSTSQIGATKRKEPIFRCQYFVWQCRTWEPADKERKRKEEIKVFFKYFILLLFWSSTFCASHHFAQLAVSSSLDYVSVFFLSFLPVLSTVLLNPLGLPRPRSLWIRLLPYRCIELPAFYVAEHFCPRKVIYSHKSCDSWAFPYFYLILTVCADRAVFNNIKGCSLAVFD